MGAHGLGGVQLGVRLPEGGAVAGLLRDRGTVTHLADGSMTVRCASPPPATEWCRCLALSTRHLTSVRPHSFLQMRTPSHDAAARHSFIMSEECVLDLSPDCDTHSRA